MGRKRAQQITSHTMEDGFDLMLAVLDWYIINDPERLGIILWDTPAGTPTRAEVDPTKTAERFGPAKIIRGYLRILNQKLMLTRWILFVVNQTYHGQMQSGQTYKAVFGGGGIPFYSSCLLDIGFTKPGRVWAPGAKERGLPPIGQVVYVKSTKNRCEAPYRNRTLFIEYGRGVDNAWTVYELLKDAGAIMVPPKQAWAHFDPDFSAELAKKQPKKWQTGYQGLKAFVAEDPTLWPLLIEAYKDVEGR